jgi:hypothetical protein
MFSLMPASSNQWGIVGTGTKASGVVLDSTPTVVETVVRTGTDLDLRTNGASKVTGSGGGYGALASSNIGRDTVPNYHKGAIWDVIIIGEAVSDATASLTRRWLGAREGITVTA